MSVSHNEQNPHRCNARRTKASLFVCTLQTVITQKSILRTWWHVAKNPEDFSGTCKIGGKHDTKGTVKIFNLSTQQLHNQMTHTSKPQVPTAFSRMAFKCGLAVEWKTQTDCFSVVELSALSHLSFFFCFFCFRKREEFNISHILSAPSSLHSFSSYSRGGVTAETP